MTENEESKAGEGGLFESRAEITTEIEPSPDDNNGNGGGNDGVNDGSLGGATPNLTDFQTFDKRMFPEYGILFKGFEAQVLNIIQMSRVFPDSFNPLMEILIKGLIKKAIRLHLKITVSDIIGMVYTALTIAIDGEGRLDNIQGFGGAQRQEAEKKLGMIGG